MAEKKKRTRRKFTVEEKLDYLDKVDAMRKVEGLQQQEACDRLGIQTTNVTAWRRAKKDGKLKRDRNSPALRPGRVAKGKVKIVRPAPESSGGLMAQLQEINQKLDALTRVLIG